MRHRLLSAIVLLLTLSLPGRGAETLYDGKQLAFWIERLKSDSLLAREEALAVLAEAGTAAPEAKPLVEKLLHSEPLSLRTRAALAWKRLTGDSKPAVAALQENLRVDAAAQRLEALEKLAALGPEAGPAVSLILEQLEHADRRLHGPAQRLLVRLGAAAAPGLRDVLAGTGPGRRAAAEILASLGTGAREAVPSLCRGLTDGDPEIRVHCARALWVLGITEAAVASVLAEAFPAAEFSRGARILITLDQAPYRPKTAVPILTAALRDGNGANRLLAARLLWETEGRAEKVLPVYRAALEGSNQLLNQQAARDAVALARHAKPLLPFLVSLLRKGRLPAGMDRLMAAIGDDAVPPLLEMLNEYGTNPALSLRAAHVLGLIGGRVVDKVIPLLDREDSGLRKSVCYILMTVGPRAAAAVPRLSRLLSDRDATIAHFAALTLFELGPAAHVSPKTAQQLHQRPHVTPTAGVRP